MPFPIVYFTSRPSTFDVNTEVQTMIPISATVYEVSHLTIGASLTVLWSSINPLIRSMHTSSVPGILTYQRSWMSDLLAPSLIMGPQPTLPTVSMASTKPHSLWVQAPTFIMSVPLRFAKVTSSDLTVLFSKSSLRLTRQRLPSKRLFNLSYK
jgi:hypothetical protein